MLTLNKKNELVKGLTKKGGKYFPPFQNNYDS